ncbi:hypothetical protein AVEN_186214-1 [Araneus ventricosus]|uniref:Uncharacterized protein n=1 Tax=Araneus ventricosus TaxID=182803 RepID=A0A4Y2QZD1_ARAVE|nr:hypothetical protein AVEN_186214-1 [Araneus ventricosus]
MGKIWFFQMYACHFQCLALSLENDIFTEICYLLNCDDKSFGVIGRRGIKTLSLLPISVITVAFTTFVPRTSFFRIGRFDECIFSIEERSTIMRARQAKKNIDCGDPTVGWKLERSTCGRLSLMLEVTGMMGIPR